MHGSTQIPTPNIDALAFSGVVLNRHYTLPTCTPSRAAFLTGKYPIRLGMQGWPLRAGEPRGLPLEAATLPERLQGLGYVTRLIGKWHVGSYRAEYTPTMRGFHSHFGYYNGYVGYFDHSIEQRAGDKVLRGQDLWRDLEAHWEDKGDYATDLFTREAERIIASHNKSRPLFLQVAHLAVHSGNASTPLEVPCPEAARRKFSYVGDPERELYAEMVSTLDESVGAIVKALKMAAMLENSIIVFLSDNGAQTFGLHYNAGSNWPLRGLKFTLFEGGVRGVAAVWSPLLVSRQRVHTGAVHISDWLPTLYQAAGGDTADLGALDGVSQWEALRGDTDSGPRRGMLLNMDEELGVAAIISGRWKLVQGTIQDGVYDGFYGASGRGAENPCYNLTAVVHSASLLGLDAHLAEEDVVKLRKQAIIKCPEREDVLGRVPCLSHCLFDLTSDPCETQNLASSHPDVVHLLQSQLSTYREQLQPQLNKPVDPASDPDNFNGTWAPWLGHRTRRDRSEEL